MAGSEHIVASLDELEAWEALLALRDLAENGSREVQAAVCQTVRSLFDKRPLTATLYGVEPTLSEESIGQALECTVDYKIDRIAKIGRKWKYPKVIMQFSATKDMDYFLTDKKIKVPTDAEASQRGVMELLGRVRAPKPVEVSIARISNYCACKAEEVHNPRHKYTQLDESLMVTIGSKFTLSGKDVYSYFHDLCGDVILGPIELNKHTGRLDGYCHIYFGSNKSIHFLVTRRDFQIDGKLVTVFSPQEATPDKLQELRDESRRATSGLSRAYYASSTSSFSSPDVYLNAAATTLESTVGELGESSKHGQKHERQSSVGSWIRKVKGKLRGGSNRSIRSKFFGSGSSGSNDGSGSGKAKLGRFLNLLTCSSKECAEAEEKAKFEE